MEAWKRLTAGLACRAASRCLHGMGCHGLRHTGATYVYVLFLITDLGEFPSPAACGWTSARPSPPLAHPDPPSFPLVRSCGGPGRGGPCGAAARQRGPLLEGQPAAPHRARPRRGDAAGRALVRTCVRAYRGRRLLLPPPPCSWLGCIRPLLLSRFTSQMHYWAFDNLL